MKTYQHAMNIAYALEEIKNQRWLDYINFANDVFNVPNIKISGTVYTLSGASSSAETIVKWANHFENLPTVDYTTWEEYP